MKNVMGGTWPMLWHWPEKQCTNPCALVFTNNAERQDFENNLIN
jgi:hypothetical protein